MRRGTKCRRELFSLLTPFLRWGMDIRLKWNYNLVFLVLNTKTTLKDAFVIQTTLECKGIKKTK